MAEHVTKDIDSEFEHIVRTSWPNQVYFDEKGVCHERPVAKQYLLGNPNLPVAAYRELSVKTVQDNLLTVISSGTGNGKSTNIPLFLFESGSFDRIYVTQPRIVAARELKNFVDSEITRNLGESNHNLVGYQTAVEQDYSEENAIVYATDGLQLMREISGNGVRKDQVLVLDEFHERNVNMDALLAIAIHKGIRVVIMSATFDTKRISDTYSQRLGVPVPIIEMPGTTYEVVERESSDLDRSIIDGAKLGKNILVFLPGRTEINAAMSRLSRKLPSGYTLLSLYKDQTVEEQSRVFPSYSGGKIIFSTSIGQTSITIPDIDMVVDCGYDRTEILDEAGVRTLATQPSSRATSDQRRGRIGRTKPGEYVRAQLRDYPKLPALSELPDYDVPAIQRTNTEGLQLKIAAYGSRVEDMPFYDYPSNEQLNKGNERLRRLGFVRQLGATALKGFAITELGKDAARLPLDPHAARMVLEARKFGPEVELQMMAAVIVQQQNGITSTEKGMNNWKKLTREHQSDVLAGIDFMIAANMKATHSGLRSLNIIESRYKNAFRAFEQLALRSGYDVYGRRVKPGTEMKKGPELKSPTPQQREQLLSCIVSGAEDVFVKSGRTRSGALYRSLDGEKRTIIKSTSIDSDPSLVIGSKFNLQEVRKRGRVITHALVNYATSITPEMLVKFAPERADTIVHGLSIDRRGRAHTIETVIFDRKTTRQKVFGIAEPSLAVHKFIINQIFSETEITDNLPPNILRARQVIDQYRRLQIRTTENLGVEEGVAKIIDQTIKEAAYNGASFEHIDPFIDIQAIEEIVPDFIREEIEARSPSSITITDGRRTMQFQIEYIAGSDRAHITLQERYYSLLPFEIGEHRVNVRSSKLAEYKRLEHAVYKHEKVMTRARRDTTEVPQMPFVSTRPSYVAIRPAPAPRIPVQHNNHGSWRNR